MEVTLNFSNSLSLLFVDGIIGAVISIIEAIVQGLTGIVGDLTAGLIRLILFFPPPGEMGLNSLYWGLTFPAFWGILTVVSSAFFVLMQLFPESDKADLDRFMKRVMFAVILVIIVGNGGFDMLIRFFNTIGHEVFPSDYQIGIDMSTMEGIATVGLTGVSALLFILFTTPKIVLTIGLFLVMLGMRAVIIYSTFVLFPILIAFWVSDLGPLSYGNMLAKFMFKATMLLLFLGLFMALILGVTGEIAGEGLSNPEIQQEYEPIDRSEVEGDRQSGGALTDTRPQFASSGMGALTGAWFSVFVYFAGIWLCITLTSMLLGGTVSPGLGKNVAKGAKLHKKAGSIKDRINDARGGNDSDSTGTPDSDDMGIKPDGSEDGDSEGMGDDSAPEPENDDESAWESVKSMKEDATQKVEETKEKASERKHEAMTDMAMDHPGLVQGGHKLASGLNLGKRGGKAAYSIWNQKSAMDTLGEAGRIARESPIGAPSGSSKEEKKEKLEDGPVSISDLKPGGFDDRGKGDQDRHSTRFDLDSTYEYTNEYIGEATGEDGEVKDMQKGYLTDTETGEQIPHVGFGDWENGEGTQLKDGQEYEFSDMQCRAFNPNEGAAHDNVPEEDWYTTENENGRTEERYDQTCATEHTRVNNVSDRNKGN